MTKFDIRKRDGLGRTGVFWKDDISIKLPMAIEVELLFPDLGMLGESNLPLCAPLALVKQYLPPDNGQLKSIHPLLGNPAQS